MNRGRELKKFFGLANKGKFKEILKKTEENLEKSLKEMRKKSHEYLFTGNLIECYTELQRFSRKWDKIWEIFKINLEKTSGKIHCKYK